MKKSAVPSRKKSVVAGALAALAIVGVISWAALHRQHPALAKPPVAISAPVPSKPARVPARLTPEETDATANAKPCDFTVLTNLDLSRPPSEGELIAASNLGKKLTPSRSADASALADPVARKRQELDNLSFGNAIQAWNEHRYPEAVRLFTEHLQSFPDSPWKGEALLHIGCQNEYVGRFTDAAELFDQAAASGLEGSAMYNKAKLRRAIIDIDLGRLDEASRLLAESLATNQDANDQSYATYWIMQLSLLRANEAAFRNCGQKALAEIARLQGETEVASRLYDLPSAGPHGFTAAELYATALQHGFDPHPVQAAMALDALPVPFVAHYSDKHYVTVEAVTEDSVKLYDSRISTTTEVPRASFQRDWSGFALLMKEPPANDGIHPAADLDHISGGCCGLDRLVSHLGNDGNKCHSCGLPNYSVNPVNMNFKIMDTPM